VTPYFSFGAGWLPDGAGGRAWTWNLSYDPSLSWATGAWLAPPAAPPWSAAAAVVGVYPHVLDARLARADSPVVGATTAGRLHFVAYVMGVAQLTAFPTQPVMNVSAAPVRLCASPPQQPAAPPRRSSALPLVLAVASPLAVALAIAAAVACFVTRRRAQRALGAVGVAGSVAGAGSPPLLKEERLDDRRTRLLLN
jgi:hypothetical protein